MPWKKALDLEPKVPSLIQISTPHPPSLPPTITIRTETLGDDRVRIAIADNGPGMTETVKQGLFEPFYTTKPVGQGTGLGLSISYQVIVDRQGRETDM